MQKHKLKEIQYNEKKPLNKNLNSWNYYFKNTSKYTLKEVYKSKNVIFTDNFFSKAMLTSYDMSSKKDFSNIINKYIHIKPNIQSEVRIFKKKYDKTFRNLRDKSVVVRRRS